MRSGGAIGDHHEEEVLSDLGSPPVVPTQQSGPATNIGEPGPSAPPTAPAPEQITTENMRAAVFKYWFTKSAIKPDRTCTASCRFCSTKYKHAVGGGYGNFYKHMKAKHPDKLGLALGQTQLAGYGIHSNHPPSLFSYDHATSTDAFSEVLAVEGLSFSFAQKVGFNDWMVNHVQPAYKPISRQTATRKMVKRFYLRKNELIDYFQKNDKIQVSICSDIWSDHWQNHSYMGVTCHWIDDRFVLHKRVLAFRVFDESHTARNIARVILTILQEYRLVQRVFSIGFDNASANTASIQDLITYCKPQIGGKYFHIRCAAHILNLCVQDGLAYLSELVAPIRFVLKKLWTSKALRTQWNRFCKQHKVPPKSFPKDVCTRWNSTYRMIHDSYEYRDVLSAFAAQYVDGSDVFGNTWVTAKDVMEVFKIFNDATYTFSLVYKPTSNLFCYTALNVAFALSDGLEVPCISAAVSEMRRKWLQYYKFIPDVFLVAFVFDPRYKIDGLQKCLENYYQFLKIEDDPDCNVPSIIARVRTLIQELYDHYKISDPDSQSSPLPPSSSSSRSSVSSRAKSLARDIFGSKRSRSSSSALSELDDYLETNFDFRSDEDEDFDILEWWSRPERLRFPTLRMIAAQILAVPASTVAVEQMFSRSGQILDEKRSSMLPETLEAQVCVNDWKRAEMRAQKNNLSTEESAGDDQDAQSVGSSDAGSEPGSEAGSEAESLE